MRDYLKGILNTFALVVVCPLAALCWFEKNFSPQSETIFSLFVQCVALLPGLPGIFLRRAFYYMVLDACSLHCVIGFGTIMTHRRIVIEEQVSIGHYAVIGSSCIGPRCEIGSRVSIPSGKRQHTKDELGQWSAFNHTAAQQVKIGADVWLGEGAIVMNDIGPGSLIGAGSVVTDAIPSDSVAVGNPARFINARVT